MSQRKTNIVIGPGFFNEGCKHLQVPFARWTGRFTARPYDGTGKMHVNRERHTPYT